MISAGDFRNGITIEYDNNVYQIIEFQHVKPGKGAAFVRTKLKNIKSGGVAAGAVVTKNVPAYEVWGGIPAKYIRKRNENLDYKVTSATFLY